MYIYKIVIKCYKTDNVFWVYLITMDGVTKVSELYFNITLLMIITNDFILSMGQLVRLVQWFYIPIILVYFINPSIFIYFNCQLLKCILWFYHP